MRAFMALCVTLVVCSAAFASDPYVVRYNGRIMELGAPDTPLPLAAVLDAYSVDLACPESLTPFLREAFLLSEFGTQDVQAAKVTGVVEDPATGVILAVDVEATIESRHASLFVHTTGDSFVIAVTICDEDGHAIYHGLDFDIMTPTAVFESEEAVGSVQVCYLVVPGHVAYTVCKCDTAGGGACTTTMCEDMTTCPDKNGTSCGFITMVLVPPEPLPGRP